MYINNLYIRSFPCIQVSSLFIRVSISSVSTCGKGGSCPILIKSVAIFWLPYGCPYGWASEAGFLFLMVSACFNYGHKHDQIPVHPRGWHGLLTLWVQTAHLSRLLRANSEHLLLIASAGSTQHFDFFGPSIMCLFFTFLLPMMVA